MQGIPSLQDQWGIHLERFLRSPCIFFSVHRNVCHVFVLPRRSPLEGAHSTFSNNITGPSHIIQEIHLTHSDNVMTQTNKDILNK